MPRQAQHEDPPVSASTALTLSLSKGRVELPGRRQSVIETLDWGGAEWLLGVGFDRQGRVRELFVDGATVGSEMEALLDDGCILLSLLLQHGFDVAALARHLGRDGIDPAAPAASVLGLVAALAARIEAEAGEAVRWVYQASGQRLAVSCQETVP